MIYSNADNVTDNIYTWNVNRNNYNNKSIKLTFNSENHRLNNNSNKPVENENNQTNNNEQTEENSSYNILLIVGSFIILSIVLFMVIKFQNKKYE